MTEVRARGFHCTIVSVATTDASDSERAALEVVKNFSTRCRAILVASDDLAGSARTAFGRFLNLQTGHWQDVADMRPAADPTKEAARRSRKLAELSRSAGLQTEIMVHQVAKALGLLKAGGTGDLLVLALPSDPLVRQAQPFTTLGHAVLFAPAAVVFVPPSRTTGAAGIVVLAQDEGDPALRFAEHIHQLTGEPVRRSDAPSLDILYRELEAAQGHPPAFIIMTRSDAVGDPIAVSRMAIRLGVPILIMEPNSIPAPGGSDDQE